jgi:hypothetical protein
MVLPRPGKVGKLTATRSNPAVGERCETSRHAGKS